MFPTAASKDPSANGNRVAEAWMNCAAGCRCAAISTIAAATSTPVAIAPRSAAHPAASPEPVPTSTTRAPRSTRAASSNGSITRLVIELQCSSYLAATASQPDAS